MITHSFFLASTLFVSLTALAAVKDDVVNNYAHVPLHFEPNQGQARDDVKFLARGPGYGVYLTANEALLALSPAAAPGEQVGDRSARGDCTADGATPPSRVLRMSLVGGAKTAPVSGVDEQRAKANYFVGADASQWRTNIPTYARVRYDAVYPGIDVVYYGNQRQLEYDFVLAPGADPKKIELQFDGADRVEIDTNGDLLLRVCGREIRQPKPVVYQEVSGRREVAGRYVHKGRNRIGFTVATYDHTLPLIIDPIVLTYATYLGGIVADQGNAIAVDAQGSAYVTGKTGSFQVTAGAYQTTFGGGGGPDTVPSDAFVAKFNADGSLAYSTYLGAAGNEEGINIAVDAGGAAYVVGLTDRPGVFPTTPGAFRDGSSFPIQFYTIFVTKLDATGSALAYSTLLSNNGVGRDIAVDSAGEAYVVTNGATSAFPTTPNAFQYPGARLFVTKFNATGSALVYSSGFGPTDRSSPYMSIALDSNDNAYVTGMTDSPNFPVTSGAFQTTLRGLTDAFVTKLGLSGELVYSTYLGGDEVQSFPYEGGVGIAVDAGNNAYVTGMTDATDFPTTPGAYRTTPGSGFVTKLNPSGSGLVYSTYLGGWGSDVAVDASGRAYIAGAEDKFFTILESSGSWASVSGMYGSGRELAAGVAVDGVANVWVVGSTNSDDFPTTPNAYQRQRGGSGSSPSSDAFVVKFTTDARRIPSVIEAENFDYRGNGLAYHDNTPGNQGDAGFRAGEDVDLFNASLADRISFLPNYIVENFEAGEWLAYTINTPDGGNYDIELRASTHPAFPNAAYHIEIDGTDATGTVVLPDTGGWDNYQWLGKRTLALAPGTHELKLVSERPYFDLDSIRVSTTTPSQPYFGTPISGNQIAAEAYDAGGQGVAYHDNSPGNQGDPGYRTDEDVDISAINDPYSSSRYVVKNFEAGEWLAYTINVQATNIYIVQAYASTHPAFPLSAFHIEVDGLNTTGTFAMQDTGGWENYRWFGSQSMRLTAGTHVIKIVCERPYFNLRALRLVLGPQGPPSDPPF